MSLMPMWTDNKKPINSIGLIGEPQSRCCVCDTRELGMAPRTYHDPVTKEHRVYVGKDNKKIRVCANKSCINKANDNIRESKYNYVEQLPHKVVG